MNKNVEKYHYSVLRGYWF